jgi:hypothetical protein
MARVVRKYLLVVCVCTACGIPLSGTGSASTQDASVDQAADPSPSSLGGTPDATPAREAGGEASTQPEAAPAEAAADAPVCSTASDCVNFGDVCIASACVPCGAPGTDGQPCKGGDGPCQQSRCPPD